MATLNRARYEFKRTWEFNEKLVPKSQQSAVESRMLKAFELGYKAGLEEAGNRLKDLVTAPDRDVLDDYE